MINSTNLLVAPLIVLLIITHVWYSESSVGITETLSHTALPSLVEVNRVASSKDLIVKNPVDNGDVSVIVTTLLATVAVKSESAFINVCRLVAVWLLLDVVNGMRLVWWLVGTLLNTFGYIFELFRNFH